SGLAPVRGATAWARSGAGDERGDARSLPHLFFFKQKTAYEIVAQALIAPGDIVLVDRNCHQSHHYGLMLAGAHVVYLDAYPLHEYSMYGGVPVREIKSRLLALRAAGKLDRVKLLMLTNC